MMKSSGRKIKVVVAIPGLDCHDRGSIYLSHVLREAGIPCEVVYKVNEGRPNTVDMIKNDQIQLIINTTDGVKAINDSFTMRREALQRHVTYYTTMAGAKAACYALGELDAGDVNCLQDLHKSLN